MNRLKIAIPVMRVYWLAQPRAPITAASTRTFEEATTTEPDTMLPHRNHPATQAGVNFQRPPHNEIRRPANVRLNFKEAHFSALAEAGPGSCNVNWNNEKRAVHGEAGSAHSLRCGFPQKLESPFSLMANAKLASRSIDTMNKTAVESKCLAVEMSGQVWHVPMDTLSAIPRVGENIHLAGHGMAEVARIDYEFVPDAAPVRLAEEMPTDLSYARPTRIMLRLSKVAP